LRAGDFDNARAAFDNGFLQDAFAEEQQHRSDFALLAFLAGWAATMSGSYSLAEERYAELLTLRPDFKIPDAGDNTLIVIETGKSPRKLADGVGHSELVYRRGKKFKEKGVSVNLGGMRTAYVMEDIYMQAATRGGRLVDRINEGKVQFRKKQTRSGSLLTESASAIQSAEAYGDIGGLGDIAAGVSLLGTLQLFAAQNAKPRADTRYWDGLPEAVHILTFNSQTFTDSEIDIQYLDKTGAPLPSMQAREPIHKTPDGVGLVWAFSQK